VGHNILVVNVGINVQGLLTRKLSEITELSVGREFDCVGVGHRSIGHDDNGAGDVAWVPRVCRILRESFIGSAIGFSNANFGWPSACILKLPTGRFLSIGELLLRNLLRLRELLLRNLQGTLRKIVGSVSLVRIEEQKENANKFRPKLQVVAPIFLFFTGYLITG
jgi:hypothetical protein